MRCSAVRALIAVAVVMAIVCLSVADPAAAAATDIGRNLGDEARSLLVALFLSVAGLVALPVLGRRDVSSGLVLALLVVVLGGFVFAQGSVKTVIVEMWRSLVG